MNRILTLWQIERRKQKGRKNFLILMTMVFITVLWIGRAAASDPQWELFLYYLPLLNALFMPVIIAVFASRYMDIEHLGETAKLLDPIISPAERFSIKILDGILQIVIMTVVQLGVIILMGIRFRFHGSLPVTDFLLLFLSNTSVSILIFLLQIFLSARFANQAVGIITGIAGCLSGFFLMFLPQSILHRLLPWGLYGCTMHVLMEWNPVSRAVHYYHVSYPIKDLIVVFLWIAAITVISFFLLNRQEKEFIGRQPVQKHLPVRFHRIPVPFLKLKRSVIWAALLLLPAISAVIGTANYAGNRSILQDGWYSLWSQHTLFLDFLFLPVLIAVFVSSLWRLEHTGTNWNILKSQVSAIRLLMEKQFISVFFCFLSILWIAILYVFCGKAVHLEGSLPPELPEWLLCGLIGSLCVTSTQLFLSLVIRNFSIPIGLAAIGSIGGLLLTASYNMPYLLPYSVLSIGMRANNPHNALNFPIFMAVCGIHLLLWNTATILYIHHSDVKTHE